MNNSIDYNQLTRLLKSFRGEKFEPKEGDIVWSIDTTRDTVMDYPWSPSMVNSLNYKIGNVFLSKKAAEFEIERLKVIAELQRTTEPYDYYYDNLTLMFDEHYKDITTHAYSSVPYRRIPVLFNWYGFDQIHDAISEVGSDRIIKYLFKDGYDEKKMFIDSLEDAKTGDTP